LDFSRSKPIKLPINKAGDIEALPLEIGDNVVLPFADSCLTIWGEFAQQLVELEAPAFKVDFRNVPIGFADGIDEKEHLLNALNADWMGGGFRH
jgi:hypothetical protein